MVHRYRNSTKLCSRTWKAIKRGKEICDKSSKWLIGENNKLLFWVDKWMDDGPIRSLIQGPLNRNEHELFVKDATLTGRWNLSLSSFQFPPDLCWKIMATPISQFTDISDRLSWASSPLGNFDANNAYSIACNHSLFQNKLCGNWIWKVDTLPKV